ncbi:MAG: flotillin domain-containing protein, partial [Pseudomonadota bacterium]
GREEEYARLAQQREIEIRRASQAAAIAAEQAEKLRESEEAKITSQREVDMASILAERSVEEERIEKERLLKEREVEKAKSVELAEQERAIAVAEKSKEESIAQAEADKARALAVKEEELVRTVRQVETAEREKQVELVQARQTAEKDAISITVAADAEKQAAEDKAIAVQTLAEAKAEKDRIEAKGASDSEMLLAAAAAKTYEVNAAGERALNEAANLLSEEIINMKIRLEMLEKLPAIIAESAKPMQQIDDIKIIQVDGLNGAPTGSSGEAVAHQGSMADQLVSSALKYRAQAPLVDSILDEIGMDGADLNGLTAGLTGNGAAKPKSE